MSEKDIESLAVGSTGQTELPRDSVFGYSVTIPARNVIENYYQFIKPIKNTESLLSCENYKLKELQSLLLARMGNLKQ